MLPLLGLAGVGQAQTSLQVQGTIQGVDCQAQTVVLAGPTGSNTIAVTPYTAVLVNSTSVPFCTLQQYIGAPATAVLMASGNEFEATRIDIVGRAVIPPPAVPAPAAVAPAPLPILGIVLGTILIAGLVYLLVRDHDGSFYRYPYYGAYYHHYYQPYYRPYVGPYPVFAPIITPPPLLVGVVLGTAVVDGLAYLIVRDHDGRYSRVPYFGPYHKYYYRAEYRPYAGPYRDAPIRQGNPQGTPWWAAPVEPHQGQPARYTPNWTPPANENDRRPNATRYQDPGGRGSVAQTPARWTPSPAYQNSQRHKASGNHDRQPQCGSRTSSQPCSKGDLGDSSK
jgi:hypothetical protein